MAGHSWLRPIRLHPTAPAAARQVREGSLERPYDSLWYVLAGLKPGDDVTVTLTHCADDYTLLGYTDIHAMALSMLPQAALSGLLDADDMDSDDMDSDDMDSDDMDSDDMDSDDMDSDDMDSDDMDSDDMDSDDMDSDDMDSNDPAVYDPSEIALGLGDLVTKYRDVYASAQRRCLRSASITPGPADEQIHMTARAGGGNLYFRVRGHLGAYAPGRKFKIWATVSHDDPCQEAALAVRWSPLPQDVRYAKKSALILTNTDRPSLAGAALKLDELAGAVDGVVYDLKADGRLADVYAAWDAAPKCVPQANAVVDSIRKIIADYAANNALRYVVIVGGDDVVPFARVEDRAKISREWKWAGPYDPRTPLGASLTYGYYLTNDPYGRDGPIDPRGKNVRAPRWAVGRLVEVPDDINAHIDWYVAEGRLGIHIERAFVSGYDFVEDLATHVADALRKGGVTVDPLISPTGGPHWGTAALTAKLKQPPGPRPHQLIAAQGHYSPTSLVPADDGVRFRPTDPVIDAQLLRGVLWTTIGCHSGHDILDGETRAGYVRRRSWAETLVRLGATMIGGTGYQYGESVLLENSELLYTYLAQEIAGAKLVTIGDALIAAKRRYLAERFELRGMDEKIVDVASIYGLPMLRVWVSSPVPPVLPPPPSELAGVSIEGRREQRILLSAYQLEPRHLDGGSYYDADGKTVARTLRPVLPAVFRDVTVAGAHVTGVLWVGGAYAEAKHDPLITRPATEARPEMPKYRSRGFLPVRPFRVRRAADGRQTLVFAAMQYDQSTGIGRLWKSATVALQYTTITDRTALHDAPAIRAPRLSAVGLASIDVIITVRHHESVDEDVKAFVSFFDGTELRTLPLTGGTSSPDGIGFVRTFHGIVPGDPKTRRVFFQAVGGNGRVSALTSGGALFGVETGTRRRATEVSLTSQASVTYRDRITVTATVTSAAGPAVSGEVLFRLGASRIRRRLRSGSAKAELTVATAPRDSTYLVVASYLGNARWVASSRSKRITVKKARIRIDGPEAVTIHGGARVKVAQLLLDSRSRPLGERFVRLTVNKQDHYVTTDPDGWLRLEPTDLGYPNDAKGSVALRVEFEEDGRYLGAVKQIKLTFG